MRWLFSVLLIGCSARIEVGKTKQAPIPPPMTQGKCTDWEYTGSDASYLSCVMPTTTFAPNGVPTTMDWFWICRKRLIRDRVEPGVFERQELYVCERTQPVGAVDEKNIARPPWKDRE